MSVYQHHTKSLPVEIIKSRSSRCGFFVGVFFSWLGVSEAGINEIVEDFLFFPSVWGLLAGAVFLSTHLERYSLVLLCV